MVPARPFQALETKSKVWAVRLEARTCHPLIGGIRETISWRIVQKGCSRDSDLDPETAGSCFTALGTHGRPGVSKLTHPCSKVADAGSACLLVSNEIITPEENCTYG